MDAKAGGRHRQRGSCATIARAVAVCSAVLAVARTAEAADVEVTSDIVAQGYEVQSPWGDVVLGRRRLMTTLGLAAYHLQGDFTPLEADYSVQLMLRLDTDYGMSGAETEYSATTTANYVPGLEQAPLDMLYGYVEGRNLWGGWFGFRLGRQYVADALGWWSFDGALGRVTTPFFVQLEAYGGLEQRGGLPLSSDRFEAQGVWRASQVSGVPNASLYPSLQPADRAPAFGVALESDGPSWLHGRLTYRRVYNLGDTSTAQFPDATGTYATTSGAHVSQDRLGYAMSGSLPGVGAIRGGFAYDLYRMLVSEAQGAVDVHIGERVTLGADVDYVLPTFDADSIWNWFTHDPSTTLQARAAIRPLKHLDIMASAGVRFWVTEGDPQTYAEQECAVLAPDDPAGQQRCKSLGVDGSAEPAHMFAQDDQNRNAKVEPEVLANLSSAYRWGTGEVNLLTNWQFGVGGTDSNRGRRLGGELSARQAMHADRFWLGGAINVFEWQDPLRTGLQTTDFGYVIAPEYQPAEFAKLRLEWNHEMNDLVGHRFRLLGIVQLRVLR